MESPRLRILILGSPVITWDNQPLNLSRRLLRVFLVYLASQLKPVSRNEACQLFWPKLDDSHAHKNLRELLSKLRSELPDASVVLSENDSIFLDSAKVYVDGWEYASIAIPLVSSSEMQREATLPDWMYLQMRKALSLCREVPILQGLKIPDTREFSEWVMNVNRTFEYSYLMLNERLGAHCISIGNLDEAIKWLGKVGDVDRLDSENNFLILNCLKDRGRIKEALDYIVFLEQVYRAINDEELPKTLMDFRTRLTEVQFNDREEEIIDWPGGEKSPYPFVGRADLLQRLYQAYHRKGIVSIKGESGVGKSRLVEEFHSRLSVKPRLLYCSGKPMIMCSPFQPLVEALRYYIKPHEWILLTVTDRQSLSEIFPELKSDKDQQNSDTALTFEDHEIVSVFNALNSLLEIMAQKKPLMMVVDIVQWCDDATINFLSYLSDRNFFRKHGLLIITSRKEEINPEVEIYVDRNTMLNTLEKIEIPPFSREETRQVVQGFLGEECDPQLLEKIYTNSGGNPYFIIEGVKAIQQIKFDATEFHADSLFPVPATIRALINEKIRLISEPSRQVLRSAAILGQKFQPKVVEVMGNIPTDELISSLEELQKFSILSVEENQKHESQYQFPHDQVREVVLSDLSPLRKRSLHLKAVKALLIVNGDRLDLASTYAYHYEEAGEFTNAFEAWLKAGQNARSFYSKQDTYHAYQKASDLLHLLPEKDTPRLIMQLVTEWGDYAYDISDISTCKKLYDLCFEAGESTYNPLLIGAGLSGKGRVCGMELRIDEGIDLLLQARNFLAMTNDIGENLEAIARLGILHLLKNDYNLARTVFEDAVIPKISSSSQRELDAIINIQTQLGLIYVLSGLPNKAMDLLNQSRYLSQLVKRRSAKMQTETVFAAALFFMGYYEQSLEHSLNAFRLADKLNIGWWQSFLEGIMARNYLAMGNMDAAWISVHALIDREKNNPNSRLIKQGFTILGDIYRFFDDFDKAHEIYIQAVEDEVIDFHFLENLYLLGMVKYRMGDPITAKRFVDKALRLSIERNLGLVTSRAEMVEFMVTPRFMEDPSKKLELDRIIEDFHERKMEVSEVTARFIRANGYAAIGDFENAIEEFNHTIKFSKKNGGLWMELATWQRYKNLYPKGAQEHLNIIKEIDRVLDAINQHSRIPVVHKLFLNYRRKNI